MAVIHITGDNYNDLVQKSEKPVLLDFWATWCGPCKMIAPILEEIAGENKNLTVGKINVDEEPELAVRFGITSIPTLIVIRDGKAAGKTIGYQSKAELEKFLSEC